MGSCWIDNLLKKLVWECCGVLEGPNRMVIRGGYFLGPFRHARLIEVIGYFTHQGTAVDGTGQMLHWCRSRH